MVERQTFLDKGKYLMSEWVKDKQENTTRKSLKDVSRDAPGIGRQIFMMQVGYVR